MIKKNLYFGDCLEEYKKIKKNSIDLILTDPPYGIMKGLKESGYGYYEWDTKIDINKIFEISDIILRRRGKLILFAQEPFTSELIIKSKKNKSIKFCYKLIWEKNNFANKFSCNKKPVNYFEDILIFDKVYELNNNCLVCKYSKQLKEFIGINKKQIIDKIGNYAYNFFKHDSLYFNLCTESVYNKLIENFNIDKMEGFKTYEDLKKHYFYPTFNLWEGKKTKSNILKYKKDSKSVHPTQKPVLLLEDLIKTYTNEGDSVVDLTMGSGGTGVACVRTSRNFIGIEKEEKYFKIAEKRINEILL